MECCGSWGIRQEGEEWCPIQDHCGTPRRIHLSDACVWFWCSLRPVSHPVPSRRSRSPFPNNRMWEPRVAWGVDADDLCTRDKAYLLIPAMVSWFQPGSRSVNHRPTAAPAVVSPLFCKKFPVQNNQYICTRPYRRGKKRNERRPATWQTLWLLGVVTPTIGRG